MNDDKAIVEKYLNEVKQRRFWGSLQLDFQDGQLVLIRKQGTIKIAGVNNRNEHSWQ
jgi:hypothetical protein